ncbi:CehA/McbA family metallohydrolase [Niameybacter massiliensis]|uniref:CehA/McbA family metallohydrolase n=1 Tax=Holtiella tumoricola TaxID=3018743 RepID=A0AA42J173_9FIRM|nr:CehA/McbA family metallohydrolase [Holtiella tumoricola]MDA3732199.1 CehA/McbA family metallohydrolase [Holtiella tumoricola]
MYKRLELHNHTLESDGNLTVQQLIDFMLTDKVDAFALTDHNTISGHVKAHKILEAYPIDMPCIYGMEYTTYYGHILCLNLKEYVPWENINKHKPELLFKAVQEKGALAGVAHPFSCGYPIATCGFEMTFTDYAYIDFIEVFNNPEPLHEVNERGLLWWEDLTLQGYRIAATSGMDLHGTDSMHDQFATFIEGNATGDIEIELETAIHSGQTWVSKGPLLKTQVNPDSHTIQFSIVSTSKPGYIEQAHGTYLLSLRTKKGTLSIPWDIKAPLTINIDDLNTESIIIPKLYQGSLEIENLVCIAPVLYL